jgi:hypothetical protein
MYAVHGTRLHLRRVGRRHCSSSPTIPAKAKEFALAIEAGYPNGVDIGEAAGTPTANYFPIDRPGLPGAVG